MRMRKRSITLLEMMVVIFLIAIIGVVVGVNMKGSLDEGKAFRTKQSMRQIKEVLQLQLLQEPQIEKILNNPVLYLERSGLVKEPRKIIEDGWGEPMRIEYENGEFTLYSERYNAYLQKKKKGLSDEGKQKVDELY